VKIVNILIGEYFPNKQPPVLYPVMRKKEDCTILKPKPGDTRGVLICLREYNEKALHPDDLKIIKRHKLQKADDGTPYYDFTEERTLEEIKQQKQRILKEGNWEFDDTIFGEGKRTEFIPAHYETTHLYWDCDNDDWKEETQ